MPASEVLALQMFTANRGVAVTGLLASPLCPVGKARRASCRRPPGHDYLAATVDGAKTWQVTGVVPARLDPYAPFELHMAFANSRDGYILSTAVAAGSPDTEFTDNGGRSWSPVHVPDLATALSLSATTLWVVSDVCPSPSTPPTPLCPSALSVVRFGALTASTTRLIPSLGNLAAPGITATTRAASLLARLGPDAAVAEEGGEGAPSSMVLTSDSGAHWHQIPDPCARETPSSMAVLTPTHWVLDCELDGGMNQGDVALYASSDAGDRWTLTAAANGSGPILGAVSDSMGYDLTASGNGDVLWLPGDVAGIATSTDGGVDWVTVPINAGGGEAGIAVAGATDAWLPAPGQGLYRTMNGTTWTKIP